MPKYFLCDFVVKVVFPLDGVNSPVGLLLTVTKLKIALGQRGMGVKGPAYELVSEGAMGLCEGYLYIVTFKN